MSDRTMGDSVTVENVPQTVDIAAFYHNGKYAADPQVAVMRLPRGKYVILWIATLDGSEVMNGQRLRAVPGVVAVQVEGGEHALFDRSVVCDPRWHPRTA